MLEEIMNSVTSLVQQDYREPGDVYPPMAHTMAKRVLRGYNFTGGTNIERIWREAFEYECEHRVFGDIYRFTCTSLPDVIGEFVKNSMGSEYQQLFDERMAQLVPNAAAAE